MNRRPSRRDVLLTTGGAVAALALHRAAGQQSAAQPARGLVVGHAEGARAGREVLAAGGNAVDAAVTAALVAGVVGVPLCGLGGYGGHLVIARAGGRPTIAIDFNSTAPGAARPDMYPRAANGRVRDRVNEVGWLAAGVPGTLAGLQLALERHGTWSFRQAVQPALRYARDGFDVNAHFANTARTAQTQLARDPGAAALLVPRGKPPAAGSRFRNPDLAAMLQTLADDNSVDAFYRGSIARRIADAFARHGGLVTAEDLAAYRAREVEPLELTWRGLTLRTAPLTAGGLTVLEALAALQALGYESRDPADPRTTHLRVEALRIAWHDRLRFLGDPEGADVPVRRLLSSEHARRSAERVEEAVREGRIVPGDTDGRPADGTIHLSAVDAAGTMVALTLTHGGSYGAQVVVEGLGLVLGHGMSRFDPVPGRPNSPGPGKRPLHNMCPTVVLRDGQPVLAVGARGGRRIPNAVFEVLTAYVGRQLPVEQAVAAARLHTEGDRNVFLEQAWPAAHADRLRAVGYTVERGPVAVVDAVAVDPRSGELRSAGR